MRAYSSYKDIVKLLNKASSIGLVPTMGSLHEGHLSLVKKALDENDYVIVSIYVNPKQFDNKNDLINYPRNLEKDLKKLETFDNILAYTPSDKEIYNKGEIVKTYDLGRFTEIMEGSSRPGHFNGVATIIEKLFKLFNPNNAYFGEKDFQQLLLVKTLVKKLKLDINIIGCKTIREDDGLAMSSRNKLMNLAERKNASRIIKILQKCKEMYPSSSTNKLKQQVSEEIDLIDNITLEYFEILDISKYSDLVKSDKEIRAFIACKVGNIRLIDNIDI